MLPILHLLQLIQFLPMNLPRMLLQLVLPIKRLLPRRPRAPRHRAKESRRVFAGVLSPLMPFQVLGIQECAAADVAPVLAVLVRNVDFFVFAEIAGADEGFVALGAGVGVDGARAVAA